MKEIIDFIKKNLLSLITISLFLIFILRGCGKDILDISSPKIDTVVTVIHHIYSDTTKSQPRVIVNIPSKTQDIPYIMLPDSNILRVREQYDSLLKIHYSKNIQEDSLRIDSFGYIKTRDIVYDNKIIDREWIKNLKIPETKSVITITESYKPKVQVYVGGGLMGNQTNLLSGVKGGVFIKDKKDQLYGINAGHIFRYGTVYELSYYLKLKVR